MSIQVLIATMDQNDHSLLEKMNIQSDAIVANQCSRNSIEEFVYENHKIKYINCTEKGVGLNRNNALMRAEADFCIIADDDLVYLDDYPKIVEELFIENPSADVLLFNFHQDTVERYIIKRKHRVNFFNFMRYGAARIAFRREAVTKHGISFNLHFGPGTVFTAGEDILFLHDCLRHGLNIVALPSSIASHVDMQGSTWFDGYSNKYFHDKGVLFAAISRKVPRLLCLQFAVRRRNKFKDAIGISAAYKSMLDGIKTFNDMK